MNVRVSRGWENSTLIEDLQWMEEFNGRGRIKPLLKIFNEWKSLTGVGELNPYWRSSMNVRVSRGWENSTLIEDLQWMEEFNGRGRIKPLLKIFDEWKSLTGVGELNPYWRSSMNVRVSRGWENSTLIEDLQWMEEFNGRGRIKPLLKIFNEWKSLTGVGELNPYWRSSMNGRV